MPTVQALRKQAKSRKIPKYSRMNKAQLLSALGMSEEKKSLKSSKTQTKAIQAHAERIAEGNITKKALIKGRITRAIKRELTAKEKQLGRKLDQNEKRAIAAKALAREAKAIKQGEPERKPPRTASKTAKSQKSSQKSHSKQRETDRELTDKIKSAIAQNPNIDLMSLQQQVGYKRSSYGNVPDTNPLNHHLKQMIDSGEIVRNGGGVFKGEPKFSLAEKPKSSEQKIKLDDVKTAEDRAKYAKQEAEHQRSQGNEKAAKAWDDEAKKARKAALDRDLKAQNNSQTSLFGVTDHASDMPLFGGTPQSEPKKPPKGVVEVDPRDLNFDPKRFQYKLVHGAETGASGSLTGVRKWDENLGGVLQVWRDPKDGKDYVVNGHNRATLARQLGAESVAVRYLNVQTPHEARAIGALTNVAEGRGTSLDAAKFFRDSGITREDLEAKGIPMKEKIATDGLALSKLAPHLFDKVVQGDIPIERATLIGDRIGDHEAQAKLVDLIDKETKKGRKITNDVVRELADTVQSAPTHSEMQFSLFGAEETSRNLALEKAEVMADVRKRLSREKKLFGVVSKSKAAQELEKAGNQIDTTRSREISEQAGQVLGVFDQLKNQSGPVSNAINKAVQRIANGENAKQVKDDLHKQLLEEIPQALGIRKK